MVLPLALTSLASVGVAVSMTMPWYRSDMGNFTADPLGSFLDEPVQQRTGSFLSAVGAYRLGFVILCLAVGVAFLAGFSVVRIGYPHDVSKSARSLVLAVALLATGLVVLTVIETRATVPLGDGPALILAWGAGVGVILAVAGSGCAWWAYAAGRAGAGVRHAGGSHLRRSAISE
jgi:hypothetical protein